MKYRLIPVFLGLFSVFVSAQENTALLFQRESDLQTRQLLRQYLTTTDSAEQKINVLLDLAEADDQKNDVIGAINKLQIALVLEDYAPKNSMTTFRLNRRMGFAVAHINPVYARSFFNKAIRIGYALGEKGVEGRVEVMATLAGLCLEAGERDSALYWYRHTQNDTRNIYKTAYASALNNTGIFYAKTGQYDSAMVYYHLALAALDNDLRDDPILFCSINDNIAREHERSGDYAFALDIYRFNDRIYTTYQRPHRLVMNKIKLWNAEMKTGRRNLDGEIDALTAYIPRYRQELTSQNHVATLLFYRFAKDYFYKTQQLPKAQRYDELYMALRDSLEKSNQERANLFGSAFLNVETTRFKKELDLYRARAETDQVKLEAADQSLRYNRRIALILVLTGIAVFGLMALYLRKSKQELHATKRLTAAELRAREMEAKTIQQELELKKKDLTNVVLQNTQLFDHDQKIIGRLQEIIRKKENPERAIHSLIADMNARNQTSDRALVIQNNIEQINAAFYEKLKQRFPDLSKSETELCGYLRINLSNKDIALLKHVGNDSIKVLKNRLRKKLGLLPGEDLYAFIGGI